MKGEFKGMGAFPLRRDPIPFLPHYKICTECGEAYMATIDNDVCTSCMLKPNRTLKMATDKIDIIIGKTRRISKASAKAILGDK
jgi:hypothetical protein